MEGGRFGVGSGSEGSSAKFTLSTAHKRAIFKLMGKRQTPDCRPEKAHQRFTQISRQHDRPRHAMQKH
eukprot:1157118-Pelagomonas_calceolata.AAC.15